MTHRFTFALVATLLTACAAPAIAFDPVALVSARRALQAGMDHGSATEVMKARAKLQALAAAEPKSGLLHYWVAFASWRAVPMLARTDKAQAAKVGGEGLAQCDLALAANPKDAEALAIKGGLLGMMISFDPTSVMTNGPQSVANIAHAIELAPENPRAWLLQGIGNLNKPAEFGGGAEPALESLRKAIGFFARETRTDSIAPDWGHDDAWVWAGRAEMKRKNYAAAESLYTGALAINPQNGWVRTALLPEAKEALAKKESQ
jgi:tetratricopeptide (TPR) repeat protein